MDCGNCGNDALWFYITEKGALFYLCETCNGAFELGQVNPDADLFYIGDTGVDDEDDTDASLPV